MDLVPQLNKEIKFVKGLQKKCKKSNPEMFKYYQGRIDAFQQVIDFVFANEDHIRSEHGVYG